MGCSDNYRSSFLLSGGFNGIIVDMKNDPLHILQHVFGYDSFRDRQSDIIHAASAGKNTLVVMPTGGGKSLCYQIPALLRDGMGIVISPLIALMQDQVNALKAQGVRATFVNSSLSNDALFSAESAIRSGQIDILYLAPERLFQARTQALLSGITLLLIAVDEAHCIAQWGHDFRNDYLRLEHLPEMFPGVTRLALTATADERTQKEIAQRLQLDEDAQFICGFDRRNIQYRIQEKAQPKKQLLGFLRDEYPQHAGIVYCLSRKKVESTAAWLCAEGFDAMPYHAGLDADIRKTYQDRFLREEATIMVATIAFGMGIDKPNVRFVVHLDMPRSLEAYYQETGRAGRDGSEAVALLYYGMEDVVKLSQMVMNSVGNESFKRHELQRLNTMLGLCEMIVCRRQALLRYFGEEMSSPCGNCDNCIKPPQTWQATEAVQKALSCVYRTGQRFGAMHVIDVLRGSDNEKIRQFGHNSLSTYGIGKEFSVNTWRSILRQLLVMGHLEVDHEGYGALRLASKCRPLLRGDMEIELRRDDAKTATKRASRRDEDIDDEDMGLWNALRKCRKDLADSEGVPSYIIFNDATLKEMIAHRPLTDSEFLNISGVGDKKLEKFGEDFLDIIRKYEYDGEFQGD